MPRFFGPLAGSNKVRDPNHPTTVLRIRLGGARSVATTARPTPLSMPAFDWKLSDAQIAAVASYIRASWGNGTAAISEQDVQQLRQRLRQSPAH